MTDGRLGCEWREGGGGAPPWAALLVGRSLTLRLCFPWFFPFVVACASFSPASATTLCTLWYRFFGSGNEAYVSRILELTKLTGAPAYQAEKDREVTSTRTHAYASFFLPLKQSALLTST